MSSQRNNDAAQGLSRIEDQATLTKYATEGTGLNFSEDNVPFDDSALIDAWIAGGEEAKVEAEKLGMKPSGFTS
jgi:hypothetical protein